MVEEIRGITWDLWGEELSHEQTIQRLVRAGFPVWRINPDTKAPESPLLIMFSIVEGESGEYKKAWHINVQRNSDDTIFRDELGRMVAKSIDLGFMQFNVAISPVRHLEMDATVIEDFVNSMFDANPDLAIPSESAKKAFSRWLIDGYKPWYAYKPGTDPWHLKMTYGSKAFSNWLVHSFVDPKLNLIFK